MHLCILAVPQIIGQVWELGFSGLFGNFISFFYTGAGLNLLESWLENIALDDMMAVVFVALIVWTSLLVAFLTLVTVAAILKLHIFFSMSLNRSLDLGLGLLHELSCFLNIINHYIVRGSLVCTYSLVRRIRTRIEILEKNIDEIRKRELNDRN